MRLVDGAIRVANAIVHPRIQDPFIDRREIDVEWVGEHAWTYATTFPTPAAEGGKIYLLFEGLDTFAVVKLNDKVILESENMFLSHRVDISGVVKPSGDNFLSIDFDSALLRGREIEKKHPEYRFIAHNGEAGRVGIRKAQYHWVSKSGPGQWLETNQSMLQGWDWGPILMTCGPWRPVHLQVCEAYVKETKITYDLGKDLTTAKGTIQLNIEGEVEEVRVVLTLDGTEVFCGSQATKSSLAKIEFELGNSLHT